jgi:hypothetical protein
MLGMIGFGGAQVRVLMGTIAGLIQVVLSFIGWLLSVVVFSCSSGVAKVF